MVYTEEAKADASDDLSMVVGKMILDIVVFHMNARE